MKWLKKLGILIVSLPVMLCIAWGMYEIVGVCVNYLATKEQTRILQTNLEREIPDIEIVYIDSETGNTSGTGNHVDCLSSVTFATEMQKTEIEDCMSKYYGFDQWDCSVDKIDGYYVIRVNTSAPFADNIAGH